MEEALRAAGVRGEVGIIPFLTVGYPERDTVEAVVPALAKAGSAVVELGVPFSDPMADGTTIQRASFSALQRGVTLGRCLETVTRLRAAQIPVPVVLMGYYNPIVAYGPERTAADAAAAGVDGFIVADLPAEEAAPFQSYCEARGLALVPLLAPTSTEERIAAACRSARGFIYCVSLTGVTGARDQMAPGVAKLVSTVRKYTALPVAVGFGISRRQHVEAIAPYADAAVVGSALIQVLEQAPKDERSTRAAAFLLGLKVPRPRQDGPPGPRGRAGAAHDADTHHR
ncbi:MAG: tryptophan synthase subunit alpha [Chloroflexi bacterium]|nr:tryptophan synthase subunit alpha [Chloroflexota bacterium]